MWHDDGYLMGTTYIQSQLRAPGYESRWFGLCKDAGDIFMLSFILKSFSLSSEVWMGEGGLRNRMGCFCRRKNGCFPHPELCFSQDILQCSQTTACIPEKLGSNPGHHLSSF